MIVRARTVVTMDGAPIENGAVAIEGEKIVDVGTFDEVKSRNSADVVDLGEQALLPGLINAHCHLDYTCLRGKIPRQKSFADWIGAIISEKEKLSPQDYVASINEGFAEAKKFGTTTIANLTAFPELISQIRPPIRTWWFAELIDVRRQLDRPAGLIALSSQAANAEVVRSPRDAEENLTALSRRVLDVDEQVDSAVKLLKRASHWGLAPHAPFTASAGLYRRCDEIARRGNVLLATHLAESREEMEMFSNSRGPLADFLARLGRDNSDLHGATPVAHASEFCEFDDRWLLVHLNEIVMDDLERLLRQKTQPHIVHCPRSRGYFGHSPFKFGKFRKLGFNICLGTDSLATNDDLNLFAEMRAFQRYRPKVSPREILEMVTVNPARALQQENALGRIQPGFHADLIRVPCTRSTSVFEEILNFNGPVDWMMIGGESP